MSSYREPELVVVESDDSLRMGSNYGWASFGSLEVFDAPVDEICTNGHDEEKLPDELVAEEIELANFGKEERQPKEGYETFFQRLRDRIDRVAIKLPEIEVRYENLSVEGEVYEGSRALPTLSNATLNAIEGALRLVHLAPSKRRKISILKDISGIVKPSRMTLLLGPPGGGKTTMMLALAGKLDHDLRTSGKISYCGHELHEFVPQRTCAYVSQHDIHHGEMTVRETLDFSSRCLGIGARHETLVELSRREKEAGIEADPEIDAFMKGLTMAGQKSSPATDYVLKLLGLDTCSDIMVGDQMQRGISGGEKKRVTTGEMLVGLATVLFMDEISNGLDTSTTFQIVNHMSQMVHCMNITMIISLLQPGPETFNLFDDVILLSEGQIVYQGPRVHILEFFEYMGFKCPERKGAADFLQEVTSKKDQEQYWSRNDQSYRYISVPEFVEAFKSFPVGQQLTKELNVPYHDSEINAAALAKNKYGLSNWEVFKACFSREWLLMKRSSFLYIFKIFEITVSAVLAFTLFWRSKMSYGQLQDGGKFFGVLFFSLIKLMFNGMVELTLTLARLPVFYKQRDSLFFPAWAFGLPMYLLQIPVSFIESAVWTILTYYTVGLAPSAARFFQQFLTLFSVHQMAISLFRFIAAVGRKDVLANTAGGISLLLVFILGGFIVARDDLKPWIKWAAYVSPLTYGQNAIVMTEFLDKRWGSPNTDSQIDAPTVGEALLKLRGFYTRDYMYWICIAALLGFSVLFNCFFLLALTFLNPPGDSKTAIFDKDDNKNSFCDNNGETSRGTNMESRNASNYTEAAVMEPKKGMVLPFKPLSLAFLHVNYYVDMPAEMKRLGAQEDRLQLLGDVSGSFRPGILTALVGVSGAGKTTLMDVLAGRKTSGYFEGSITISGYPKNQDTFARISGYCEQNDIHSPHVTVYESVMYSAWLRLPADVKTSTRKMFVEEVMELVELNPMRNLLVGMPGIDGLSTEQRKRLTIAVELIANPSIIFMDEPTSGLDARAAAIVMRVVRNTVDTGRTVVCTIHQPSIDIFESFDELLLMKIGGQIIYAGELGHNSQKLIDYFEAIPGVPKIKDGYNPATWILEISAPSVEAQMQIDFADSYKRSSLYRRNEDIAKELGIPQPGTEDLYFQSKYSRSFFTQCRACFWKQRLSYWRNPSYNAIRFFATIISGLLFGITFWKKGQKTGNLQDLMNLMGAMYSSILLLGATNTSAVLGVVSTERVVFYRERAAGMYSELPYALAQIFIEIRYIVVQALVYNLILYSMIGFVWNITKLFWFYFIMMMCFTYYTIYGMMLVALTPSLQIAGITMTFFLNFWNLFSGFLIPRLQIPIWWRWYYWASPVSWTIYGVMTCELGDNTGSVVVPGASNFTVKGYLNKVWGYDYKFLPAVGIAHIGWALLFTILFAFGIKFLNFQKR